jgi:protein-tyrosine phosphatase
VQFGEIKNYTGMRAITPNRLWIGNAREARDVGAVSSLGIKAVVDLAANELPIQYARDMVYCRLPLNDGPLNDEAAVRVAVSTTAELIKSGVRTLVTCSGGMSRSPAIVAAAIAMVERITPDNALVRVTSTGPHDVAPGLWGEIKRIVFQ